MPSVVLREKIVSYELGEHEPPDDGKRLLFVHGENGSLNWWETQLNEFSHRHDTYALDLPGHGASAGPQCETIYAYRDGLSEFIEGMAIEPAVLVGHSLGALVAVALAAHNPDLVEGLVLVSMYTDWRPAAAELKTLSQTAEMGAPPSMDQSLLSSHASDHVRQWAGRQTARSSAAVLLNDWTAVGEYDVRADFPNVQQPALLVVGADDPRVSVAETRAAADLLPHAQIAEVPKAGHLPMVEQAPAFETAVLSFLRTF